MKQFFLFLTLALSAAAADVGQPAPAWHLNDLDGQTISSDQFKGKVVIIDFWATWCGPCRKEIPGYIALEHKYAADGLAIVGVSLDSSTDPVKRFMREAGINYQIGMSNDAIYSAFNSPDAIPTTILIDRQGIVRDVKLGGEPADVYEKKVLRWLK